MGKSQQLQDDQPAPSKLEPYLSPLSAWALSVGTAIGWGSFVITGNTLLTQAGPLGSVLGLLLGLAMMLLIGNNYRYLMGCYTDAGGTYSFVKGLFGPDHGFVVAWFLGLTYAAILWANATSLPLFLRYLFGDVLSHGAGYQFFGYQVYLNEVLFTMAALVIAGTLCVHCKRIVANLQSALALGFTALIVLCFVGTALRHDSSSFAMTPLFTPGTAAVSQVLGIACMTPWAFIGFEGIAQSVEEFSFSHKTVSRVLLSSLITTAVLYIVICLMSVTAYPTRYDSWYAYLCDLGNLSGLEALPVFYAAQHYLGQVGVASLMAALLALIITSLFGNVIALTRLIYALAVDGIMPARFARLNKNAVPVRAMNFVMAFSLLAPLLGRTTIGWIVDVTTLGATMTYAFVSAATYRQAAKTQDRFERVTGAIGLVSMLILAALLLLPNLFAPGSMAPESYFLFTMWAVIGFVCFRLLLNRDTEQRFGHSTVVWIALLSLVLVTSLTWMRESLGSTLNEMIEQLETVFHHTAYQAVAPELSLEEFLGKLHRSLDRYVASVAALFAFSLGIMLSNFSVIQRRERESKRLLGVVRTAAYTDPLTGVKSKQAYAARETEMNERIAEHGIDAFAIVVCDVNNLKVINDTLGHKAGDEYICAACRLICTTYKHSPVFRIGGDEFVAILTGGDYERRDELTASLDWQSVTNNQRGDVVVATGMSDFRPKEDQSLVQVFKRADTRMYRRKKELKDLPIEE